MLNFVLFSIPKEGIKAPSIYPAFKALILIINYTLTFQDSAQSKKHFADTSYVGRVMSIWTGGHRNSDYCQTHTNKCFSVLN